MSVYYNPKNRKLLRSLSVYIVTFINMAPRFYRLGRESHRLTVEALFRRPYDRPTHALLNEYFALHYSKGYFQSLLPLLEL